MSLIFFLFGEETFLESLDILFHFNALKSHSQALGNGRLKNSLGSRDLLILNILINRMNHLNHLLKRLNILLRRIPSFLNLIQSLISLIQLLSHLKHIITSLTQYLHVILLLPDHIIQPIYLLPLVQHLLLQNLYLFVAAVQGHVVEHLQVLEPVVDLLVKVVHLFLMHFLLTKLLEFEHFHVFVDDGEEVEYD